MEGGENEAIEREEYSVLRIQNINRVKVGCRENERIGKMKTNACVIIHNEDESFDPICDSIALGIV